MQPYRPFTPSASFTPSHTPQSPSYEKETHLGDDLAARQAREAADGVVRDYEENQARYVLFSSNCSDCGKVRLDPNGRWMFVSFGMYGASFSRINMFASRLAGWAEKQRENERQT